jgi:hypothetical protein
LGNTLDAQSNIALLARNHAMHRAKMTAAPSAVCTVHIAFAVASVAAATLAPPVGERDLELLDAQLLREDQGLAGAQLVHFCYSVHE